MHACHAQTSPPVRLAIRKELMPDEAGMAKEINRAFNAYAETVIAEGVDEFGPEAAGPLRAAWESSSKDVLLKAAMAENAARRWKVDGSDLILDNPYAAAWVREQGAEFVTNITAATRETIRVTMERGFLEHLTAREQGRMLRSVVTLHSRQVRAVEFMLSEALAEGVDQERAVQRATSYATRLLAQRALGIARTEIIRAEAGGLETSWMYARGRGWLLPTSKKKWIASAASVRTCAFCRDMNGATAPIDGVFKKNGREAKRPPGHTKCRCGMALVTT